MPTRPLACAAALGLLLSSLPSSPIHAESDVVLPGPGLLGGIEAGTYDETGKRVGDAELGFRRLDNGHFLLRGLSGIQGSARSEVRAELEVYQQTEAHDEGGRSLGVTAIDHRKGVATCGVPEGSSDEPVSVELPDRDRVVNVPLNLLFQPLVLGEVDEVEFQVLLCRAGARLVNARAEVAGAADVNGERLVEIRYNLDFGPLLSRLAAPFLPQLSFWFDEARPGSWVAHRMPLFSKGPTVLVIRSGFSPSELGNGTH